MPLETATFITDLVTSNPAHSDGLNNADAHLRLIKGTLKATFPNFTDAALQSTQAKIDAAVTAVDTNGVSVLAEAVNFTTNTSDGFGNPAAGTVSVVSGGTVSASFQATAASVPGTMAAPNGFLGPGSAPIGSVLIWPFNELPTGFGMWAWCNGQAVSRTTFATFTAQCAADSFPYGAGDGSTTVNVPNYQEVTLVGRSTMGGAASPGLLNSISAALKAVLNGLFGSDTVTLAPTNIPTITSSGANGISVEGSNSFGYNATGGQQGGSNGVPFNFGQQVSTTITSTGTNNIGVTSTNTGGSSPAPVSNVTPSRAVNFIIRLA